MTILYLVSLKGCNVSVKHLGYCWRLSDTLPANTVVRVSKFPKPEHL